MSRKIKSWILNHKIFTANIGLCFALVAIVYTPACAPTPTYQPPKTPAAPPPVSVPTNTNQSVPQEQVAQPEQQEQSEEIFLVTRVIDGDTIELENGEKVRYIGIDTPETVDPSRPVGCFGKEASNKNKELVENKRVRLERDVSDKDRYGRLLRYVYVGDLFVNLELVKQGYATSYTYPPDVEYQDQFVAAQKEARDAERGLWGACQEETTTPTPPVNTNVNTNTNTNTAPPPEESDCSIKGNISSSGEKIYHVSGCSSYNATKIDESKGERWFCTEAEAVTAGWRKAKNCP